MIFNFNQFHFFILFHYYNRCYCYFKMLYWFLDVNEPKLLFYFVFIFFFFLILCIITDYVTDVVVTW